MRLEILELVLFVALVPELDLPFSIACSKLMLVVWIKGHVFYPDALILKLHHIFRFMTPVPQADGLVERSTDEKVLVEGAPGDTCALFVPRPGIYSGCRISVNIVDENTILVTFSR